MTELEQKLSLVELEELTDEGKLEMAAAKAEVRISHLLRKASMLTNVSQRELADKLGVTEGRVSQVLNSEGNIRVSTAARYLRAMGYGLQLDASPADQGAPSMTTTRRRRKAEASAEAYVHHDPDGNATLVLSGHEPAKVIMFEDLTHLGRVQGHLTPALNQNPLQVRPGSTDFRLLLETGK